MRKHIDTTYGTSTNENTNSTNYGNLAFQGMNFLGQNLGNLAYLKNEGKDYDKVDYGTVTPEEVRPDLLNAKPALQNARIQAANTQRGIRGTSVGGGNYLSNLGASQAGLIGTTGNIIDKYAEANTGITNTAKATNVGARNQAKMFNQQNRIQAMRDEAANKGVSQSNYYKALGATGQNLAGQSRDIRFDKRDEELMKILPDLYKNPEFLALMEKYKK